MTVADYVRFVLALCAVLGLIGLVAIAAKRMVPGLRNVNAGPVRRTGVVEVVSLDARRRLVLVRRDDVEHLLVLGPNSETVVEAGIRADAPRRPETPGSDAMTPPEETRP